jgi:uncharacterized protein (DUF2384 family)
MVQIMEDRDVISDEARQQNNLAVLRRLERRRYGTRLSPDEVTGVLHVARAQRDAELSRLIAPALALDPRRPFRLLP